MKEQITFDYERVSQLEVVRHIEDCEGRHVQQAIYSTFMGTLTQICFTEQKIRGSIYWEGNRSWTQKEIQGINTLEDQEEKKRGQDKYFERIPQRDELPPPIPSVEVTEYKGVWPFGRFETRGLREDEMAPKPQANPTRKG